MNSLFASAPPVPVRPCSAGRSGVAPPPVRNNETEYLRSQLLELARNLSEAQSYERARIAAHLHDELGQHIVLIRLKLAELRSASFTQEAALLLNEVVAQVSELSRLIRATTFDLNQSATSSGLLRDLRQLASESARLWGLPITIDEPTEHLANLPGPIHSLVCNVVRELCLNVHKHALASQVQISLRQMRSHLRITVQDDGDGIAIPIPQRWQARRDGGFGLASAQTRLQQLGGQLRITSRPGQGTRVCLLVPIAVTCQGPQAERSAS